MNCYRSALFCFVDETYKPPHYKRSVYSKNTLNLQVNDSICCVKFSVMLRSEYGPDCILTTPGVFMNINIDSTRNIPTEYKGI